MAIATMTKIHSRPRGPLGKVMQSRFKRRSQRMQANEARANRNPRILCIDDDPEICRTLEMRLSEYQAEVLVAYYGTQGFWEAITDHPDLILMDIGMPSGDGRFVLESIRNNKTTERIPVIVLTGKRDEELKAEMYTLGADQYLTKPIQFDILLREMQAFVEIRKKDQGGSQAS